MTPLRLALRATLCVILAGASGAAVCQKIYRCGPGGTVYTQTPCDDGKEVKVSDRPTSAQRRQAVQLARNEKHQTREIELQAARRNRQAGKGPVLMNARPVPKPTPTTPPAFKQQPHPQVVHHHHGVRPVQPPAAPQPQQVRPGPAQPPAPRVGAAR